MRSLKHTRTAQELLDAYRTWYNYVRPHMALGGSHPPKPLNCHTNLAETNGQHDLSSPEKSRLGQSMNTMVF
ncbi:integrase core domain-containing protein [[Eubacterium] cellulosolvens]